MLPFLFACVRFMLFMLVKFSRKKSKSLKLVLITSTIILLRLFIHKFCNNSKILLSFSWAIFIRALVFSFSPSANIFSFEYLWFPFLLIFQLILIWYTRVKPKKKTIILLWKLKSFNSALLFVSIQQITIKSYSFLVVNI